MGAVAACCRILPANFDVPQLRFHWRDVAAALNTNISIDTASRLFRQGCIHTIIK